MSALLKKFVYWLPTLLWMSLIFSFSSQPALHASPVGWQDLLIKKTAHVTEYFVLALLFGYSLRRTTHFSRAKQLIFTILFIIIYASSDEFHQLFILTRDGRVTDVLIDTFGGCMGLIFYRIFSAPGRV